MKKIIVINFFIVFFLVFFLEIISNFLKLSNLMGIQEGLIYSKNGTNYLSPYKKKIVFNEKVFIDDFGMRVPNIDYRHLNDVNIFILGDSVSFGNGIKEDKTFIGLLRNKFKNKNFLNSSVPGYQIKDHVNIIKKIDKLDNVEKVIYFFTLNDIYGTSNIVKRQNKPKKEIKSDESDYKLKKFELLNKINTFLRSKSYLYMLIKGIGTDPSKRYFLNLIPRYLDKNLDSLKKNFQSLKTVSQNNQSEFLVIILPYEFQTRNCTKKTLIPQKKVTSILSSLDITYKDLTNYFCDKKKPKEYFYKFDPMHLSNKGHMLVYNILKDEIIF